MTLASVSDAGPLIRLAEIDSLELLATFDTLLVPGTVYEAVDAGGVPDGSPDFSDGPVEAVEESVASGNRMCVRAEPGPGGRSPPGVRTDGHDQP